MFINWKVSEVISLQWTQHRSYSTLYTYESIEILDLNPHVLWRRCWLGPLYRYAVTQQNQLDFVSAEAEVSVGTNYVISVKFSMLTISGSRRAEQYQRKDKKGTVHLMRGPFRPWFE